MKKILVLILLFCYLPLCAQTFINSYFTPDGDINIRQHIAASGGGYFICGTEQEKGFIAQLDSIGSIIWKKQYDTGIGVFAVDDLVESKNGSLIAILNTVVQQNENAFTTVFKLSAATGAVLWTTQWSADKTTFTFIEPSTDGYILAGSSFNNDVNLSISQNQRLAKINENGNIIWRSTFETPFTKVRTLHTDALGNAYITGTTNGSSFLDEISIFAPNGSFIDNFGYNGNLGNNFIITAMRPLAGGDYLLASTLLLQGINSVMVVFRIRPTGGDVLWSRAYRMSGFNWEIVDMEQLPDGQFVALCKDRTSNSTAPVALLKFKSTNSLTWMRGIDLPSMSEMGTSLSVSPDGYIEISGNTILGAQTSNGFFIRADSSGSVVGDCPRPNLNVLSQNVTLFTNGFGYGNGLIFNRTVVDNITVSASELTRKQEIYVPNEVFSAPDTTCTFDCVTIKTNDLIVDLVKSEWVFDGGRPDTFSGTNPPPICYEKAGIYTITLTTGACATATRTIVVNTDFGTPNAFTPNNDNLNDTFRPLINCQPDNYQMRIFNRWGNLVFETTDYLAGWDGTYQGDPAPMETYIWTVESSNTQKNYKGQVTLLR